MAHKNNEHFTIQSHDGTEYMTTHFERYLTLCDPHRLCIGDIVCAIDLKRKLFYPVTVAENPSTDHINLLIKAYTSYNSHPHSMQYEWHMYDDDTHIYTNIDRTDGILLYMMTNFESRIMNNKYCNTSCVAQNIGPLQILMSVTKLRVRDFTTKGFSVGMNNWGCPVYFVSKNITIPGCISFYSYHDINTSYTYDLDKIITRIDFEELGG